MRLTKPSLAFLMLLGFLIGCGRGGADNPHDTVSVSIAPSSAQVTVGGSRLFVATVSGGSGLGVSWTVQEGATGGTVLTSGLYTAPSTPGTFHLVATSVENTIKSATVAVQVIAAPVIDQFTVMPNLVSTGGAAVLQGAFSGGTASVDQGVGPVANGQAVTVHPTQTTVYTLTVTNAAGTAVSATATVNVPVAPVIQSFLVSTASIVLGGSVDLTPTFSDGTGVISPGNLAVTSGTSYTVTPAGTTTYTLTVSGSLNQVVTQALTVTVRTPLAIPSFSASPAALFPGGSTLLAPVFAGGTGVITPGAIPVQSGQSYAVSPASTTTFTLTVTDPEGNQVQATTLVTLRAHGSFSATGTIGTPRKYHTATLLKDGTVLIVGGIPADEALGVPIPALNVAERYNPATGSFSPVGVMVQPRTGHAATLLQDGTVLITGGNTIWSNDLANTPQPASASAELWDPATGQFTALPSMSSPRRNHTSTRLPDGTVLIAGGLAGQSVNFADVSATAEIYDPVAQTFTLLAQPMSVPRQQHQATPLQDGTVLLFGGTAYQVVNGTLLFYGIPNVEIYTPGAATPFGPAASSLGTGRGQCAAVGLANGNVLVGGGVGPASTWVASTEIFTLSTRAFTPSGSLQTAMSNPVAALLASGQVALVGIGDTEVLNTVTGNVATVSGLGIPNQGGLTATTLANGKVLVVNLEGASLFDPLNP